MIYLTLIKVITNYYSRKVFKI